MLEVSVGILAEVFLPAVMSIIGANGERYIGRG